MWMIVHWARFWSEMLRLRRSEMEVEMEGWDGMGEGGMGEARTGEGGSNGSRLKDAGIL